MFGLSSDLIYLYTQLAYRGSLITLLPLKLNNVVKVVETKNKVNSIKCPKQISFVENKSKSEQITCNLATVALA